MTNTILAHGLLIVSTPSLFKSLLEICYCTTPGLAEAAKVKSLMKCDAVVNAGQLFSLFFCKKPGKETDSLQVAFLTIFFQDTLEERWEPRKNSDLTHLLCKIFCSALATIPIRKLQVLAVSAPLPPVQFNCATPSVWILKV